MNRKACCVKRLTAAIAAIVVGLPIVAAGATIGFKTPKTIALQTLPHAMDAGDLDRDGHADVVITHYLEGTLEVLLGNGQSSFATNGEVQVGIGGIRAYIVRLDADDIPDVIVSLDESDDVALLRGNGDGTFEPVRLIHPGHDPVGVAVADLDGDTILDLVVALSDEGGGAVAVMHGLGDMQFERVQDLLIGDDCVEVVVDDFDGNGLLDAAASNPSDGTVVLLRGIAGGMFEVGDAVPAGPAATFLALADVDRNGSNDIVVGGMDDDAVRVLRSRGNGTFDDAVSYPTGGRALNRLLVTDVNHDGITDIVTSHLRSQSVNILLGRDDGTFAGPIAFTSGSNPVTAVVANVDSDEIVDLIAASEGVDSAAPTLTLLHGDGTGRFRAPEQLLAVGNPVGVAVGDFNGDAVADVVVGSRQMRGIVLFPGASDATAATAISIPIDREPVAVRAADLDADGRTDIVTLNGEDMAVLFADAAGGLTPPTYLPLPAAAAAFTLADLDGDGDDDLVAAASQSPFQFYLLRNDGNRVFTPIPAFEAGARVSTMARADINGDGRTDVITNDRDNHVLLFVADDETVLRSFGSLLLQGIAAAIAVGDVDANGAADVLAVSPTALRLSTFLNDGTGTFGPTPPQSVGFADAVTLRDLDGDGFADAVTGNQLTGETTALQNDASGGWRPLDPIPTGERVAGLAAGDFDDDGRYDLIATGARTYVLLNDTAGEGVVRGDGNGDGRVTAADLVALTTELFDGDGVQVEGVSLGTFAGRAGADSDGDGVVTGADLRTLPLRLMR